MRSLTFKLTLAFLLVGLTGSALVALFVWQRTQTAFDQFIANRDQQTLADSLEQYYQTNGTWDGLATDFRPVPVIPPHDDRPDFRRDWERFMVVGANYTIVFSILPEQIGQTVSERDLERAIVLESDSERIGWLVLAPGPREWIPDSLEVRFLQTVGAASLFSALIAILLALTLGGLLAFTMTRSLRDLTEATLEIARGRFGGQVKVRSNDELGKLAASFNQMSLDLERATHARRQMTADIAHDLRSPLSVISGYAEALSDGKLPGTPEIYAILYQETRHLSRLVEDLRLLSLADAHELSLTLQPVPPAVLLERAAARHAVAAQQKEIALRVEAGPNLPAVQVDVERMAQVFDNLLVNAFRYTPQGGEIILSVAANGGQVAFQVADNGGGIAPEDLPHIFDRFYRGEKARPQNGESGLGLAIAKSLVEAHHGTITVESMAQQGTTFTIRLAAVNLPGD